MDDMLTAYRRIFYRCVDWNQTDGEKWNKLQVASFTDAWIETCNQPLSNSRVKVASFTDAWIETLCPQICRGRGLRRIFYRCVDWNLYGTPGFACLYVASFTDAWIETERGYRHDAEKLVASFTDAWIETIPERLVKTWWWSRIFYRCVDWNSKYYNDKAYFDGRIFYRCVDWNNYDTDGMVWKESRIFYRCVDWNTWGLESQGTGMCRIFYRCVDWNVTYLFVVLCPGVASFTDAWIETFPYQTVHHKTPVASFTDAWIETPLRSWKRHLEIVASFTDAWIETFPVPRPRPLSQSHLLQMRGLKPRQATKGVVRCCRIFYRCVDWNRKLTVKNCVVVVASFTDAWIETNNLCLTSS